ncbi:Protein of unknown function [Bacillus thuringiensis]|uniref:Uncharacterized protein n=1 Tax=Bacillus thuringiensis TaxID=1428 RepID=A0A1C4FNX0_BACTU|nr:Protein of unknown function [Bacillus thuringiensis]SCM04973.1 Protein of unknown function [Bacillus wiedmannii]SCN07697.1 Protein of unknown function [Bacillus wiedmannii]
MLKSNEIVNYVHGIEKGKVKL